jgi:hypothetical protein
MNSSKSNLILTEKFTTAYENFWNWFHQHQEKFYNAVKISDHIEEEFFDMIAPKLDEIKEGIYFLSGMIEGDIAELVLTADGNPKNIVFIEELIAYAPKIDGWQFTALKAPLNIEDVSIDMNGYHFDSKNISFYSNEYSEFPDVIDITFLHEDLTEENKIDIVNGVYIFLDNFLGEVAFINNIDNFNVIATSQAKKELVPISKLKDFLIWRQKEFVEKYDSVRYNTKDDEHSMLEGQLENGNLLIAVVNTQLVRWEGKASHPWISNLVIHYDGSENGGLPNKVDMEMLNEIEEELLTYLKDSDGFLNVGRQTTSNEREIFFACKEFKFPSKVFSFIQQKYADKYQIDFDIYKDKYWQTFQRYSQQII